MTSVVPQEPIKMEGFSPCDVETFPAIGPE